MNKILIPVALVLSVLLIASAIPNSTYAGPVKEMDPPDGNEYTIGTTDTPPVLDGVVNVGSSWESSQLVGGAYIAMQTSSVADVFMVVEVDSLDQFQYLWIGVKPISPYFLKATNGQWLHIDWDQDGKLDYEDHTGWGVTDGADTAYGAEWMIPWGQARLNPGQTPYTMDSDLIGYSFDIMIHVEVWDDTGDSNSATYPNRPIPIPGEFNSTTIIVQLGPSNGDDDDNGIRSKGFWKHQMRTAFGRPGHQHVPTDNLTTYLDNIDQNSDVSELQGLRIRDALMILEIETPKDMYSKAVAQLLALWLNLYHSGDQMVDTDGDNTTDMNLSDAIDYIEDILTDPAPLKKDLEEAKNMADIINNSGED